MPRKIKLEYTCLVCSKEISFDITDTLTLPFAPGWESFKGDYLCDNCVKGIQSFIDKRKEISSDVKATVQG